MYFYCVFRVFFVRSLCGVRGVCSLCGVRVSGGSRQRTAQETKTSPQTKKAQTDHLQVRTRIIYTNVFATYRREPITFKERAPRWEIAQQTKNRPADQTAKGTNSIRDQNGPIDLIIVRCL